MLDKWERSRSKGYTEVFPEVRRYENTQKMMAGVTNEGLYQTISTDCAEERYLDRWKKILNTFPLFSRDWGKNIMRELFYKQDSGTRT